MGEKWEVVGPSQGIGMAHSHGLEEEVELDLGIVGGLHMAGRGSTGRLEETAGIRSSWRRISLDSAKVRNRQTSRSGWKTGTNGLG